MADTQQISDNFYARWCAEARRVRPHQQPPTKDQMEWILSILTEDQRAMILEQFDGEVTNG